METHFKNIVFIDDDVDYVNFYLSVLERKELANYIKPFNNAKEGFKYLKKAKKGELPDYILLDLNMPEMDGFAFLERIEKLNKVKNKVEVYVCTSSAKKEDKDRVMRYRFVNAFLQKPVSSEFLEYLINDNVSNSTK